MNNLCVLGAKKNYLGAIAILAALEVAGCAKPTMGVVTGTVTVDGVPAKAGSIAFFPVNGKSPTAGAEIVDGQYMAQVSPGGSKVEIRVPKVVGQKKLYDTPDSPMKPLLEEMLPAKYNEATELTIDVQLGNNQHDFQLQTK